MFWSDTHLESGCNCLFAHLSVPCLSAFSHWSLSSRTCKWNDNYADILKVVWKGCFPSCRVYHLSSTSASQWLLPQSYDSFLYLANWFQSNLLRFDFKELFLSPCWCKITICLIVCSDLSGLEMHSDQASHPVACTVLCNIQLLKVKWPCFHN